MRIKLLLMSVLGLNTMFSQEHQGPNGVVRCATQEYEKELQLKYPNRVSENDFEKWLAPIVESVKKERMLNEGSRAVSRVIRIPVVVHVMHNGDAVGTGENIANAQVLSQIQVLNQDFRRMVGTPGFNNNPVGADLEIEFVMATRTPAGLASTGIDRVQVANASFNSRADVEAMKATTVWDTTKYLNMWVIRIGGVEPWSNTLGYAQFPQGSNLIGVYGGDDATNPTPANTDGLVMRFGAFGSRAIFPGGTYDAGYDLGRTTTHEIGHWVGLRHIWGDGDCTKDDFCADTPNAAAPNYSCNFIDSCPDAGVDMIENYMDYTNDACMNIFTQDQKNRVLAVMHNGIRRKELLASPGLIPLNLAVEGNLTIHDMGWDGCSANMLPVLKLTNYGVNTITSAQILYDFDQQNTQTFNWNGNLAPNASVLINLPSMHLANPSQTFYASLERVNNVVDGYLLNNEVGRTLLAPTAVVGNNVVFQFQPDRFGSDNNWVLRNSANAIVHQSPVYADRDTALKTYNWNLANGCYTLTINDTYGDGLQNDGYYKLLNNNGGTIFEGGGLKQQAVYKFAINQLSNSEFEFENFSIYPVPNNGEFTIQLESNQAQVAVKVYDLGGRAIFENIFANTDSFNKSIDVKNIEKGTYLVEVSDGVKKSVKRILVH